MIGAFAPPIVPPQAGNAPLDARTPPVSSFPAACMFQGLTFLRDCACCWDRHQFDPRGRKSWLRLGGVHSAVTCHQIGWMLKERLVMRDRLGGLLNQLGTWVLYTKVARSHLVDLVHIVLSSSPLSPSHRCGQLLRGASVLRCVLPSLSLLAT